MQGQETQRPLQRLDKMLLAKNTRLSVARKSCRRYTMYGGLVGVIAHVLQIL